MAEIHSMAGRMNAAGAERLVAAPRQAFAAGAELGPSTLNDLPHPLVIGSPVPETEHGTPRPSRDPHLDAVCRIAAELFAVPFSFVSLLDDARQCFVGNAGLPCDETPSPSPSAPGPCGPARR